jgi:general secretion pathway protein L
MASSAKSNATAIATLSRAVSRFLAWWATELAALIPFQIRQWWQESDRTVLIRLTETTAILERVGGGKLVELLSISLSGVDIGAQRTEISRKLPQLAKGKDRLLLGLAPEKMLRRTLVLPLAVEENLRQTLSFELDRFTPFKPDQVYFDYRIANRDSEHQQLTIELAVVKRAVVDTLLAQATGMGLRPSGVVPSDDLLKATAWMNFLPKTTTETQFSHRLGLRLGLSFLALLLLASLLLVPVWQKRTTAISLLAPLAEAKASALATNQLRDRLDKLVADHNFLPDKKWTNYSPLLILDELSKLLPDDTFVMALEFDGKIVQIQGESGIASKLVEILDASPMFKDVGFKAQLTKIQGTTSDRFHISAALDTAARPVPPPAQPSVEQPDTEPDQALKNPATQSAEGASSGMTAKP